MERATGRSEAEDERHGEVDATTSAIGPQLGRARYNEFADWYVAWVGQSSGVLCREEYDLLPARLNGQRWLDVACGQGRTSRELARRGAEVTGIDLSAELIGRASAAEPAERGGVCYVAADITQPGQWWDGRKFDGVVCEMAFMDIDDLDGALNSVARAVEQGAPFLASLVHPCFPGNEVGLSSWPPEASYFSEGFWHSPHHNPDGARIRLGSNHRTLSTYLNAIIGAGLVLERVIEPVAAVPTFLVLACRGARPDQL